MDCHWHHGVDFSDCPEGNMDNALIVAMPVHNVQRCLEELEQHILALEQEPRGPEEPSISDDEAVSDGDDET